MPSRSIHEDAARAQLAAYRALPDELIAPRVMMLFLCGLHTVEILAASESVHNRVHQHRADYLRRHPSIWRHYQPLAEAGKHARYCPPDLCIATETVETEYYRRRLRAVIWEVEKRVGQGLAESIGIDPNPYTKPATASESKPQAPTPTAD